MAAVISIRVETTGGIDQVKKDVQDLGRTAEQSGSGFSALKEIGVGALRAVGEAAFNFGVAGIQKLAGVVSDSISAARESNMVAAQTAQVIKSTGSAAGVTAQHVLDYASALSAASGKSLFGDEQIAQSSNLLLTFTNIKGATLDAATAISVDMAQALGGAPKDAAIQLGKALNDPVKGITALTRVGVTFSDEQKAMIQAMTEAGDTAGAQKVILDELNKEFGGSAEAAAKADGGWAQFHDRMGEVEETIGKAILPLLGQLAGFLNDTIAPAIESAANVISDLVTGGLGVAADDLREAFGIDIGPFVDGFRQLSDLWAGAGEAAGSLAEQIGIFLDSLISGNADVIGPFQSTILAASDAIENIVGAFQEAGPMSIEFGEALGTISPTLQLLQGIVAAALPEIQNIVTSVFGIITGFIQEHGATIRGDMTQVWQQIQGLIQAVLPPIQSIVQSIFGAIALFLHNHGDEIKAFLGQTWDAIAAIIKIALALIQAIIVPVLTFIAGFIASHGTEIQALLTNTWNAIKAVIDIALTLIRGILQAALQLIQGDWSGAWETIKTMCARVVQDIITILQSAVANFVTIGGDIINGVISGINGAISSLKEAVSKAAQGALDAAKHALGISSPSSEAADQIGVPFVQGIISGIESMIPAAIEAVGGVSKALLDQADQLQEKLGDIMGRATASAFGDTADMARQAARNITSLQDLAKSGGESIAKHAQELLAAAQSEADMINQTNPDQAAAYFKLRSGQIFELAKLQKQLDAAKTETERAAIMEQMTLIQRAQQAEVAKFNANLTTDKGPLGNLRETITKMLNDTTAVLDEALKNQFSKDKETRTVALDRIPQAKAAIDALNALLLQIPIATPTSPVGPLSFSAPAPSSGTSNQSFTYAPTINTTGGVSGGMDLSTAKALSGV